MLGSKRMSKKSDCNCKKACTLVVKVRKRLRLYISSFAVPLSGHNTFRTEMLIGIYRYSCILRRNMGGKNSAVTLASLDFYIK